MKTILIIFLFIPVFSIAQHLYFPPKTGDMWDTISTQSLNWCQSNIDSLFGFLEESNTQSFILLKDGKIVLEKYFGTYNQNSLWYWASAGKTLTAFMVGIAQQEKYLSISDTVSKYLGKGWTNCTPQQEEKITIRHQLTMTSGLDDGVPDPFCTLANCLNYKADAGTRWSYHNAPYTLLDKVIENATGSNLNGYITQKLKNQTGITGLFLTVDYNNIFFSNARSMARFGLLTLNRGVWDDNPIMKDTSYFGEMTRASQNLNQAYGYLWWLNSTSTFMLPQTQFLFKGQISPNAPFDMFAAMGKNGQFINVVPSQNLVWVRMGEAPDNLEVPFLLNDQIWQRINRLGCNPLLNGKVKIGKNQVSIFPNPVNDLFNIKSENQIDKIEIYDYQGHILKHFEIRANEKAISMNELSSGIFIMKIYFSDGKLITEKVMKE
jgi:CubicO group peptidase (beta-lactamase class C family)